MDARIGHFEEPQADGLSRRGFMAAGGFLAVSFALPGAQACAATGDGHPDATAANSWLEIRADNTVLFRTGKCDFGQGSIYVAYPQIIAEELDMPFEAVTTVISGDTDRTPDGGGTFGLLRTNVMNLRKVAAYTREAALKLAAERLGVAQADLTVSNGVISGGGKSVTYGDLVKGRALHVTVPVRNEVTSFMGLVVDGDPKLKQPEEYKVVGKSFKNPAIATKVAGKDVWAVDVKLPNMLHGRVVHPETLGSTLVEAGKPDAAETPNARVVVVGNLVGVVAPTEWEAISAARTVAASTKWSAWKGLPGNAGLFDHMRTKVDWKAVPATKGAANKGSVGGRAAKTLAASYEVPFKKHAPIGPSIAVADVRKDGSVTVHTSTQNPQYLRKSIALMLSVPTSKVVVRSYPGSGHYGRSNGGNSGAEDEAVLLSRAVGRPVRLQWMRAEDMAWSTSSPPSYSDVKIGLDRAGKIDSYQIDHYAPPMQDDRLIGAVLAGLPAIKSPGVDNEEWVHSAQQRIADRWLYDVVPNLSENGHGAFQLGEKESPIGVGLRDHSMRTPVQLQQNFPREAAINEAAALARADAIQFRLDHTSDKRLKNVLVRLREESGWEVRPSPARAAASTGDAPVRGRGASVMLRDNGYWACAAEVQVVPATGEVKVQRITMVVDPGIVVNPLQLKRQAEAGCLMGVSETLFEDVAFNESAITSDSWATYPILTMADSPAVKIVLAPDPDAKIYGQGSESANALAGPAIVAAVFDATGKAPRRMPLRPDYVKGLMSA